MQHRLLRLVPDHHVRRTSQTYVPLETSSVNVDRRAIDGLDTVNRLLKYSVAFSWCICNI